MKPVAIFRHSPGEGPGYFATFLDRNSVPWRLFCVDEDESIPVNPDAFSGLVFMGGPMSVNDTLPWIDQECALIRAAVDQDVPVIGHCLGGQLIAKALGGVVTRNPVKEIGWGEVVVSDNEVARRWFGDFAGHSFLSFHWHGETFSIPPGATCILSSAHCRHQAFALGPHLAMQCHVEMVEDMIAHWCETGAHEINASIAKGMISVQPSEEMQSDLASKLAAMHKVADCIYSCWIEML